NSTFSFNFRVKADGGTANSGQDTDTIDRTATINVTSVNSEPSGTTATVTTNEDVWLAISPANFGFSDVNDNPTDALGAVKIAALPPAGAGTLVQNPSSPTRSGSIVNGNITITGLSTTRNLVPGMSVTGTGIPNNTTIASILSPTSITISAAATQSTSTSLSFPGSDTVVNINTPLTVNGGASGTFAGGLLVFKPTTDVKGTTSFTFQVKDSGGTTSGGQDTDQSPNTLSI